VHIRLPCITCTAAAALSQNHRSNIDHPVPLEREPGCFNIHHRPLYVVERRGVAHGKGGDLHARRRGRRLDPQLIADVLFKRIEVAAVLRAARSARLHAVTLRGQSARNQARDRSRRSTASGSTWRRQLPAITVVRQNCSIPRFKALITHLLECPPFKSAEIDYRSS
jgi:hypothetical protein